MEGFSDEDTISTPGLDRQCLKEREGMTETHSMLPGRQDQKNNNKKNDRKETKNETGRNWKKKQELIGIKGSGHVIILH